jgi:hypothetical protein
MDKQTKLFEKLQRRLELKAIDKISMEIGTVKNFHMYDRFDGEMVVSYVLEFDYVSHKVLKEFHETNVILLKDTQHDHN